MPEPFLPHLTNPENATGAETGRVSDRMAVRFGDSSLTFAELARAVAVVTAEIEGMSRVGILAFEQPETAVAVVAALAGGVCAVPFNPRAGPREIQHVLHDSTPDAVLVPRGEADSGLIASGTSIRVIEVDARPGEVRASWPPPEPDPRSPALIMYTSGTTGPPKGAVLPRSALSFDIDALAEAWEWTSADRLVHALPLYHVHGLVLGLLAPLRLGAQVHHTAPFDPHSTAEALADASMLFAVPTMYRRLAEAASADEAVAASLRGARLLVSGSAGLPASVRESIETVCGRKVAERYGMTETCITTAVPARALRPGTVGPPLPGVELQLVDDTGSKIPTSDHSSVGEILVRGPSVFLGYLDQPDATACLIPDGWVHTGDMASRDEDGYLRILGRKATDLISSGGFRIGAGEIEETLEDHPAVVAAAVTGLPDPDLGERIAAWIVLGPKAPSPGQTLAGELSAYVAERLAPHKRPRDVFFIDELPRNALGKVQKSRLASHPISRSTEGASLG